MKINNNKGLYVALTSSNISSEVWMLLNPYPNAIISHNSENYSINLGTGLGASIYPKADFELKQAIQDQIDYTIE